MVFEIGGFVWRCLLEIETKKTLKTEEAADELKSGSKRDTYSMWLSFFTVEINDIKSRVFLRQVRFV